MAMQIPCEGEFAPLWRLLMRAEPPTEYHENARVDRFLRLWLERFHELVRLTPGELLLVRRLPDDAELIEAAIELTATAKPKPRDPVKYACGIVARGWGDELVQRRPA